MIKTSLSIFAGALFVTGCLFPSFDDMQSGQKGAIAPRSDDEINQSQNGTTPSADAGSTSDSGTTPTPSPTPVTDGGVEASVTSVSSIACGNEACLGTSVAPFCCSHGTGALECTDNAGAGACEFFGGHVLACDDSDDCTGGQVCCWSGSSSTCRAASECTGVELCKTAAPKCTGGKQCTGTVNHPSSGFTSKSCQ